jgi:hypothetical protein
MLFAPPLTLTTVQADELAEKFGRAVRRALG